ncbi:TetR family transcriptional regulator [Nonomuraea sp. KC401]|uniref:TetR/AcrR family transcriptional regulator n=1 Tax=unclassified Nonomuraea TaxID=2593643 RepID=UPI0010FEB4D6|nr:MULTISPECIES: TetR family transcriptional regulator [unclassified Nonomuraea]NBE96739.1 TetR family transcriptional regulator [Nonomuraea sp. K271]TLF78983.1 TetR family transcriptional regulator [Nonomuraea sp. KC401]
MGLRELKKEQTRRLLMETAWRLFADRGFDQVRVTEIAQEAQVSEATVFKYFPAKEDLFYSGLDDFGRRMVAAVAERPAGEAALDACRRFLLDANDGLLAQIEDHREALDRLRTVNRVIANSPTLRAREEQSFAHCTTALAEVLATEAGAPLGDPTAAAAAHALVGVHRTLVACVRRRITADDAPRTLRADLEEACARAFAVLERGLSDYAVKPA